MINAITIKCPSCGSDITAEAGKEHIFCTYCGTKILLNNDHEYVYRHIDEAAVKHAETEQIVRLKEMELEQKEHIPIKVRIAFVVGIAAMALVVFLIGFLMNNERSEGMYLFGTAALITDAWVAMFALLPRDKTPANAIKLPKTAYKYKGKDKDAIAQTLHSAGFTNITCIPFNEAPRGLFSKPNTVISLMIDNEEPSDVKRYLPDANIVISYRNPK